MLGCWLDLIVFLNTKSSMILHRLPHSFNFMLKMMEEKRKVNFSISLRKVILVFHMGENERFSDSENDYIMSINMRMFN